MKKFLPIIFALLLMLQMVSCRSSKSAVTPEVTTPEVIEEPTWSNVQMPVKVSLLEPQKMSFNGTATLVRNQYVLISIRIFGFEIGQMNLTPEVADMVVKQPSKVWIQTPVSNYFETYDVSFTELQEVMMGNRDVLNKIPSQFSVEVAGTEQAPEVTLSGKVKGKQISMKFAWDMSKAKWDQEKPAAFTEPGSAYKKTSLSEVLKTLGAK